MENRMGHSEMISYKVAKITFLSGGVSAIIYL